MINTGGGEQNNREQSLEGTMEKWVHKGDLTEKVTI